MSKNPLINAISATLYITLVAAFMFYGSKVFPTQDTVLEPIGMISLFTLSAAVMAYIFLYQPVLLFIDNKKKLAVNLFLKTVVIFAIITVVIFTAMFFGLLK